MACVWPSDPLSLLFFSSRRRHTRLVSDWSSDVCSSDLERTGQELAAGRLDEVADGGAVVDHEAEMAPVVPVLVLRLHEGDELVAHVDEGLVLALAAQGELEDAAIEGQRLLDVTHLERDVIDAHQLRPPSV